MTVRKRNRGHPFLRDKPKGVWIPEAVGVVHCYPKTEAAFLDLQAKCREQVIRLNAEGKMGRRGVPDGWAGRKQEAQAARADAHAKAEKAIQKMIEKELIVVPEGAEARSEVGLVYVARVVLDPTENTRERLQAAKTLLDYTTVKPTQKQEVTIAKAEDFLNSLIG